MDVRSTRWMHARNRFFDPIVLRKRAAVTVLVLGAAVFAGGLVDGGAARAIVIAGWVLLVPVAVALGYGEAFFIGHGRGARRATLLAVISALASLAICAMLSTGLGAGLDTGGRPIRSIVTLVLFLCAGVLLASVSALGFGLGTGYLARKVAERDADDWP